MTKKGECGIIAPSENKGGCFVGLAQLISFIKEAAVRLLVIILAVILVMLVASRNVEFELEQQATRQPVSGVRRR